MTNQENIAKKSGSTSPAVNQSVLTPSRVVCTKRALTPSKLKVADKRIKRQRLGSTDRLVTTCEKKKKGRVALVKAQRDFLSNKGKLILDNQRLWLERKHRTELHEVEKNALILETELRTVNRLLQQENTRLLKENKTLRLNSCHRGLEKCEIERRRKVFPWLQHYARERVFTQYAQSRKTRIGWKDLPDELAGTILKLLSDEDLFVLRELNTKFYEAFYSQGESVDCERCIWLAKRGRKFVNLKFINAFDVFTWKEFRVLGPSHFPNLEVLWLESSPPRLMKSHPNLKELQFTAHDHEDLQWVSDKKFPSLEVFILFMEDDLFDENPNRLRYFAGHKNLVHIGFAFCDPSLVEIREFTKAKFPKLRAVGITGEVNPEVLDYLQQQDIEFTDSIKEISINSLNFLCQV